MSIEETFRSRMRTCVIVAAAVLLFALAGQAQDSSEPKSSPPAAQNQQDRNKLMEFTRVSTGDAARQVAKQEAKQKKQKTSAQQHSEKTDDIVELRPAGEPQADSNEATSLHRESKKSSVKNIHGNLSGAHGENGRRTGISAGASSRSGSTHVYVETERSSSDAPH